MWTVLWKPALGVFVACLCGGVLLAAWHHEAVNWKFTLALSTIAAVLFTIRYALLLLKTKRQFEGRQKVFLAAVQELIDAMARLSPADISVFVMAARHPAASPDQLTVTTARGSANHHVLVQMADLGLVRPDLMRRLGPDRQSGIAQYALTPDGKERMAMLLDAAGKRRRFFAERAAA